MTSDSPLQAPHWLGGNSLERMMRQVLYALTPTIAASYLLFGPGVMLNLFTASTSCLALEALMLIMRGRPVARFVADGSALVTAFLIALAIPALTPWWVTVTACFFAIVFAKHVYGGLGYNVFNPAMVGYVVVLVSFPQYVAEWPALTGAGVWTDWETTVSLFLSGAAVVDLDAISGATPLDAVKTQLAAMRTMQEISVGNAAGWLGGYGWEWINIASLMGGLWLLRERIISWHAPAAMLATVGALYLLFYFVGSTINPTPFFGLLSGGTMLAAFFIVTDPVSGAATPVGRVIFGAGAGALTFAMRKWGAYPDGIAFAVLLMNMAAPLIDRYTLPRVYGHRDRS